MAPAVRWVPQLYGTLWKYYVNVGLLDSWVGTKFSVTLSERSGLAAVLIFEILTLTLRMTNVFSCHSEERSDEESNSYFLRFFAYAQNDIY